MSFSFRLLSSLFLALVSLTVSSQMEACTGIRLKARDGSVVHGRTLEFGIKVDTSIVVVPRNHEFIGTTPLGEGLTYKSKYAVVGAIAANRLAILDGMNEKGLAVGTFYFPGMAGYANITQENQSQALSPVDFPNWIVTQFATIDELKSALSKVAIAPTVTKEWGSTPAPFHYIVYDQRGNCLVIEPVNGKLLTYDNPFGVLTNAPGFDWHATNLRNYINMTFYNAKPVKLNGVELKPFGLGSGMVGLPGDFTPPSRFVRATIFSATAVPEDNANDAVFQAFHILNQFDIPVGVIREKINDIVYTDSTLITCVRNPQTLKYYFKTYDDQTIKSVDLNKFDWNATSVRRLTTASKQEVTDLSADLK